MPFAPQASDAATARRTRADLSSSAGAGILGFGLGGLVAENVAGLAVLIAERALERGAHAREPWWCRILYWGCWIALGVLAVAIGWRLLQ